MIKPLFRRPFARADGLLECRLRSRGAKPAGIWTTGSEMNHFDFDIHPAFRLSYPLR